MAEILLATESAVSRAPELSNARLLNYFVERQGVESKGQAPLFGAPGITTTGTGIGTGPFRGGWNFNGVAFYVSGSQLWRVDSGSGGVVVGDGIGGGAPCGMSDNGVQMCIVNGEGGFIYTDAGGLVPIASPAFYPAATVTFMDGYFIFDRVGTNEWFLSALYDGLTYNGLDFATAEGQPGFVRATKQNLQLLFIFCSGHIELWYDAGTADFPFQRYSGGLINYGTDSPYSIIEQDGAIFFLGADHIFYRLQGNVVIRVSTHPIEHEIQGASEIVSAFCLTWSIEGHKMVALTLPSAKTTVCFDISTGKWHHRNSVDADFADLGPWRVSTVLAVYDDIFLGDSLSGTLGRMDWSTYTEYGNPMVGLIRTANQQRDRQRTYCSRFELDVQAGVGLATGQGSDPLILLQKSVDGGMTFGLQQAPRSIGKIGEYAKRVRWLAQGMGWQICWQLLITDPVQRVIIAAYADIEYGM